MQENTSAWLRTPTQDRRCRPCSQRGWKSCLVRHTYNHSSPSCFCASLWLSGQSPLRFFLCAGTIISRTSELAATEIPPGTVTSLWCRTKCVTTVHPQNVSVTVLLMQLRYCHTYCFYSQGWYGAHLCALIRPLPGMNFSPSFAHLDLQWTFTAPQIYSLSTVTLQHVH